MFVAVPRSCDGLTAEKLRDDGIFLYENGADAVLFFGPRVDPGLVQAVLGTLFHLLRSFVLLLMPPTHPGDAELL